MHGTGGEGSGEFTPFKAFSTIFISFVGAGMLGLPFAFSQVGVIAGVAIMVGVSFVSVKAMLLLVDCKNAILEKTSSSSGKSLLGGVDESKVDYGDLAFIALGHTGRLIVQGSIVLSQVGFCCGYLIFISHNLRTLAHGSSIYPYFLAAILPQFALSMIRNLSGLSTFSLLADVANVFAYCVVFYFDFHAMAKNGTHVELSIPGGFAFFFGVVVYCFEGAGMVISLERSFPRDHRHEFKRIFAYSLIAITTLYTLFGMAGYLAFGPETHPIITLNLPRGIFPSIIICCLCFSLLFTYPVMMFPVSELLEKAFFTGDKPPGPLPIYLLRWSLVVVSGLILLIIPDFGDIIGFIGSTCCMIIAFILPPLLHLRIMKDKLTVGQRVLDCFTILLGCLGFVVGTADAIQRIHAHHKEAGNI